MATAALAAAAAIQAARDQKHAGRWLALATVMSIATVWVHYSGILLALVVALYVWTLPSPSRRARMLHVGAVLAAVVIVAPLMIIQLRAGHQGGIAPYAKPTLVNFLQVLATPFAGRFAPQPITTSAERLLS